MTKTAHQQELLACSSPVWNVSREEREEEEVCSDESVKLLSPLQKTKVKMEEETWKDEQEVKEEKPKDHVWTDPLVKKKETEVCNAYFPKR